MKPNNYMLKEYKEKRNKEIYKLKIIIIFLNI